MDYLSTREIVAIGLCFIIATNIAFFYFFYYKLKEFISDKVSGVHEKLYGISRNQTVMMAEGKRTDV